MKYTASIKGYGYSFTDLKTLLGKASPLRLADELAGIAAGSEEERAIAQRVLADVPLNQFLTEPLIPADDDEVTRLILETRDSAAFVPISALTVGEFREWLLSDTTADDEIAKIRAGLMPEMAAAVSKIMRNQDLIAAAKLLYLTEEAMHRRISGVALKDDLDTTLPAHPEPLGLAK
ncbi:ethanolamine ammonia-lyase subunit EutB [Methylocaldum sp.]|uniref:ethanolamine ammonia-lyase subunit EutB n=1 Tax=Methylocaldum sp. TaxID=1969727 RepID=UPI002D537D86|nr:ethanolamine ammonia-lyase subunit EutB [Methylocaldum sp.]HYE34197.1 ethanolamine ammonia-lyase subunit EutB [Methylocaldum sp.]